jgi:hypothetical protein
MHSVDSDSSGVSPVRLERAGGRGSSFLSWLSRLSWLSWLSRHRLSLAVLAGVLAAVGLAMAWNLEGWPGRVDDDEGTYVAQAWAMLYEHTLTHYLYWYDHPPLGWAQIALFAWITNGFNRVADAVFVGREFMWLVTLISCTLLYALGRRLSMRRATSAATVALFGLSPLGQYFHRLVSLDNVETMWVLAALVAATSPRRGWRPAFLTGACAAIAVLSKETALIMVPVIVWVLVGKGEDAIAADREASGTTAAAAAAAAQTPAAHTPAPDAAAPAAAAPGGEALPVWKPDWSAFADRHAVGLARLRETLRRPGTVVRDAVSGLRKLPGWGQRLLVFALTLCLIVAAYPLYALSRGEWALLWSTLLWQFFDRPGSGSLLNSSSATYTTFHGWLAADGWLLSAGLIAALFMLGSARLRPFAALLLLQVVVLVKGSYLPFFYVTALLPFAALALGGAADVLWTRAEAGWFSGLAARLGPRAVRWAPYAGAFIVTVAALAYAVYVVPTWISGLAADSTANGDAPYLAAAGWAERNVPKQSVVVVDDYLWVDLKRAGLSPLWMWKINPQTTPDGWKSIDYIILQPQSAGTLAGKPALAVAYAHSVLVKDFGNGLTARRVTG